MTTVTLWPTMASQRRRTSVLRRSLWLSPRSGVFGAFIIGHIWPCGAGRAKRYLVLLS